MAGSISQDLNARGVPRERQHRVEITKRSIGRFKENPEAKVHTWFKEGTLEIMLLEHTIIF